MKIIKIGDFDNQGWLINWEIDLREPPENCSYCMYLDPDGSVLVNGIEIVEWTEKRREAMK